VDKIYRVIAFGEEEVGRRRVHVMRIWLGRPVKGAKPFFEAEVNKELVKLALKKFKLNPAVEVEDRGRFLLLSGERLEDVDDAVRKLIVFSGALQGAEGASAEELAALVRHMGFVESLFWSSRFLDAHERGTREDVERVAKALRILYRIEEERAEKREQKI